jgi:Zn finger protein HypA/HybF involved in hydrogenase expression
MAELDKCKNPDGTTDWEKYQGLQRQENAERKAKGELCQLPGCNRFIVWSKGHPQTCSECKSLDNPEELNHPSNIRCPKCGHHWSVWDGESYELHAEGDHEVTCPQCDHEFEVVTSISYDFQSPERIKEKEVE